LTRREKKLVVTGEACDLVKKKKGLGTDWAKGKGEKEGRQETFYEGFLYATKEEENNTLFQKTGDSVKKTHKEKKKKGRPCIRRGGSP